MRMIADLWPKIDSDLTFTTMKTILLERFPPRTTDCLESFFAAQRGDGTVTKYLLQLQTLLTLHYSSDSDIAQALIRRKILDSVDAETNFFFNLYIYPSDSLESDGGANKEGRQLTRPASRNGKILLSACNLIEI